MRETTQVHRETRQAKSALTRYLGMGPPRSLRALSVQLRRDFGDEAAPTLRQIENWSTWFGWQRKAEIEDAETEAEARAQFAKRRAKEIVRRQERRLRATDVMANQILDFLTEPVNGYDEHGNPVSGPLKAKQLTAMPLDALKMAIQMFLVSSKEERLDLGHATDRSEFGDSRDGEVSGAGMSVIVKSTEEDEARIRESLSKLVASLKQTEGATSDEQVRESDTAISTWE